LNLGVCAACPEASVEGIPKLLRRTWVESNLTLKIKLGEVGVGVMGSPQPQSVASKMLVMQISNRIFDNY
jgi:hypothetical protein